MPIRTFVLLAAATAALAVATGCETKPDATSTDPAPVAHSSVRTGLKGKPGARGAARSHKLPMQTGPAQSSTANDL
ncbi:hypothetical protein [Paludisphaera borealis]|uniref:Lipoprotein n=1 Tax=Paludisphaera borealis TaxID=1387353 RepID=A0A1U7CU58_9BACT|nr:hypothetical protein [Paludisphaera borealis]APW62477.1 hypothetical protein BSF38_04023 [Paludisphaera borealis]